MAFNKIVANAVRWFFRLVEPGGFLLLIVWGVLQVEIAHTTAAPYARVFFFTALAAAAMLGWFYNRGRVLFVVVAIAFSVWGLEQVSAAGEVTKLAVIFLLPLNIALFATLEERGVLTASGIFKIAFLLAQGIGVVLLGGVESERLEAFLRWHVYPGSWTAMPLTEQLAFAAAGLVLLVLFSLRRTKIEQGLFWALVAVFVAHKQTGKPEEMFFYAGAAGVILLVSVLEHSYNVAYLDELTGVPGRRSLNERLAQLGGRYAIAMCDIDHFKQFNDTYGHDVGDQVLKMVASRLSRVRGAGRTYRYGGEEFTVLFPGYSVKEALPLMEELRESVANSSFRLRSKDRPKEKPDEKPEIKEAKTVTVTISIGVAEYTKDRPTAELVIEAADAALYRAKEAGRNCIKTP
jgi:diguanylate cyclase (GGDEF)-like protein